MAHKKRTVTGGVDTHGRTHHAAVVDEVGRVLGDREFPASADGYAALLAWLRSFGRPDKVGVEGTGTYGAGLARYLTAQGVTLVEVDRPNRRTRRAKGKSDPIDAIAAARAAASGEASGTPKTRTGPVEAIRALRVARRGAVKARTAALNQLHCLIASAPESLRAELHNLKGVSLVDQCAATAVDDKQLIDPTQATIAALCAIAHRIQAFDAEIALADRRLRRLVGKVAPRTMAIFGVGPEVAGQLITTAGDNPDRLRSQAAWPTSAAPHPSPPAPAAPTATGSTVAATAPPTTLSTRSCSTECATTYAPTTTCTAAPKTVEPPKRSSAASSDTSSARSTPLSSPTSRPSPLDIHRSIPPTPRRRLSAPMPETGKTGHNLPGLTG
jgi:transposase